MKAGNSLALTKLRARTGAKSHYGEFIVRVGVAKSPRRLFWFNLFAGNFAAEAPRGCSSSRLSWFTASVSRPTHVSRPLSAGRKDEIAETPAPFTASTSRETKRVKSRQSSSRISRPGTYDGVNSEKCPAVADKCLLGTPLPRVEAENVAILRIQLGNNAGFFTNASSKFGVWLKGSTAKAIVVSDKKLQRVTMPADAVVSLRLERASRRLVEPEVLVSVHPEGPKRGGGSGGGDVRTSRPCNRGSRGGCVGIAGRCNGGGRSCGG
ncbi:hypothetical protein KM043_004274 [Ampulex compressa]|nr:hypothetical protein KM043_004274 [Ampulex compressa]